MKRIFIICFVMIMLCTTASAAVWQEGRGPEKPYSRVPEVDFNKTVGYMIMTPVKGSTVIPGTDILQIFMPRDDVQAHEGTLTLYNKTTKAKAEIGFASEAVTARPMTEEELESLLWGCGTVFEIKLEKGLEPNCEYYVELSEGCIKSPDYEPVSQEYVGKDNWVFNTKTDNVVKNLKYYHEQDGREKTVNATNVKTGDKAKFSVVISGDAVMAAVYYTTGAIEPGDYWFSESGDSYVVFPQSGEVSWGVVFMNAEGGVVSKAMFTTNVLEAEEAAQ